ncbi:MAG: AraC family transcriptional regulator [Sphingomonas sp.]
MGVLEKLSTGNVAPRDRLPYWNEIAQRMIAPIRVEALGETPFQASIARRRFRDFELISPRSSPARIFSAPDHERAAVLNIQFQHSGRSTNHTAGRTCVLEEGDFLVYDPSRPLWLTLDEPTQAIVLRLPLAAVEERLPHLREMAGIRMSGSGGPGAIFSSVVRSAWTQIEDGDGDWMETLPDVIWPLLHMTFPGPAAPGDDRRASLRRELFTVVDAELCDPDFDTHRIAQRLGVSARYVQILFAEMATTPTAFIRGRRLELAAQRLAREGMASTITDVAFAVGFNDLSSFCRAFRQRFDVSARDYRAGMGRGGGAAG